MNMNKMYIFVPLLALIFLGAGCTDQTSTPTDKAPQAKPAQTSPTDASAPATETKMMKKETVTLQATALGKGMVKFQWEVADDADVNEDGFLLVRSDKENPEHDGKNYWFKQYYKNREVTWIELPIGSMHFRICLLEDDRCETYSNNVELDVK